ncbi:acetoacetate--CoA ligase [Chromatiales bacterium (ex Bugula neritina AB1)]|nr:acetoacetate--CoA ligase [Chromatiales bacterium (ex Bugula neritina AB1)]
MPAKLWQPSATRVANSNMTALQQRIERTFDIELADYQALHQWSLDQPERFWSTAWDQMGVVAESKGDRVLLDHDKMPGARWFPDARLNFAENLLKYRGPEDALVFRSEANTGRTVSRDSLYQQVASVAAFLRAQGVEAGDRVAGFMPNMPETIVAMLAAASIGAVWSSSSPDFGVRGVVDRFGQIEPKVLFTANGYFYNGKFLDSLAKVTEFLQELPSVEKVVVVDFENPRQPVSLSIENAVSYADALKASSDASLQFEQLPFDHPLYIMYSSGTTGVPKCIVHGAGGSLLQHLKEQQFHVDLREGDRFFYFTTCGWMMWNWLVTGLASGATLLLYDGSPFYPNGEVIFDFADETNMNILGTSAKFIDAVAKSDVRPAQTHQLASVRSILSTGSTLSPESFQFVYDHIKDDVCLSSVSGGTDILACFVGGNPTLPVYKGELQCRILGMATEVFDDQGKSVTGEKGELVCTQPFPSMPVGFWNDPDGKKYHRAYFARYPNVWCHGDFVELTASGGMVIHGRSDTVLNPGGVRIGTAEIYRQVERHAEVQESLVIGQQWDNDTRVVLFVTLRNNAQLDDELVARIKRSIRTNCTPRHVPAKVIAVADIPRTKSGKIVELAVRNVVHGEPVKNKEALANPDALEHFANLGELQS